VPVLQLGDDAFQISLADQLEQPTAVSLDMVCVAHSGVRRPTYQYAPQFSLPVNEGIQTQISSVARQDVEGEEAWLGSVEQQVVELGIAVRIKADDFAIEDCSTVRQGRADRGSRPISWIGLPAPPSLLWDARCR
jgi:hypothetical protein